MCGIGGVLGHPQPAVLNRMNHLQKHRGPDEQSTWVDHHVGFAHTRLAILDVDGSQQPISAPNGSVLIVNGEIYNHEVIRHSNPHYPFSTAGDSEAILALHAASRPTSRKPSAQDYANWLGMLDGMYALALWDAQHEQLILARDPMGIKPLMRTQIGGDMLFASEVKAFHADERYTPQLDELAFAARLVWEYPLDATTLLKGVHHVRPGTVEVWSTNQHGEASCRGVAEIERQAMKPAKAWDPSHQAEPLLDSFITSVQQRLMADVPVGIVLSGGLDSSLVAAVAHEAAQRADQPVPECWTVAESEENPDWIAAEHVASHFDLRHHQHLLEQDAFEQRLPQLVWHGEDIDVTVLFFNPLFEHMSRHVKVGLCGQGADELHAGYPRYGQLTDHNNALQERMQALPDVMRQQLKQGRLKSEEGWYLDRHQPQEHTKDLQTMLDFELNHGQLSNFQLRLVDRHSMAHSLEVRVPFLGSEHRKETYALPMDWRRSQQREEKAALRRAADLTDLPKDIVRRPKLPAGRATSPTMLNTFLDQYSAQTEELMERYKTWAPALKGQEELSLGLGLFEALHLQEGGYTKVNRSVHDLLNEVIEC